MSNWETRGKYIIWALLASRYKLGSRAFRRIYAKAERCFRRKP